MWSVSLIGFDTQQFLVDEVLDILLFEDFLTIFLPGFIIDKVLSFILYTSRFYMRVLSLLRCEIVIIDLQFACRF